MANEYTGPIEYLEIFESTLRSIVRESLNKEITDNYHVRELIPCKDDKVLIKLVRKLDFEKTLEKG
jgi:hypothetical protein